MSLDLYKTLGVAKDANDATIKKAYRKLSLKHHPDRNPGDPEAEQRFKDVQRAYLVLSDPDKRTMYDNGGTDEEAASPGAGKPTIQSVLTTAYVTLIGVLANNHQDPRYANIVDMMRQIIEQQIQNLKGDLNNAGRAQGFIETTLLRLSDPESTFRNVLEDELSHLKDGMKKSEEMITLSKQAISYLRKCGYKVDPPPTMNFRPMK
jgi:DnaJ-class molecular chaperone